MRPDDGRPLAADKTTLFCPACGHSSSADGDWRATTDAEAGVRELHCPDCGQQVTSRPVDGRVDPSRVATGACARPTADD